MDLHVAAEGGFRVQERWTLRTLVGGAAVAVGVHFQTVFSLKPENKSMPQSFNGRNKRTKFLRGIKYYICSTLAPGKIA